jgi:hypothetical protein
VELPCGLILREDGDGREITSADRLVMTNSRVRNEKPIISSFSGMKRFVKGF